jgi:hypothetical protein
VRSLAPFAVVLAVLIAPPALAKHGHASHSPVKATAKAGGAANTKATSSSASGKGETGEKSDIINVPRSGTATVKAAHAKAFTPAKVNAPRVPATPIMRNAVGMTVVPHPATTTNVGGHPKTIMSGSAGVNGANVTPLIKTAPLNVQQHPIVSANIGSQGKIGDTTLIRPTVAPSGLGGPAKTALGINGTTMRLKHN